MIAVIVISILIILRYAGVFIHFGIHFLSLSNHSKNKDRAPNNFVSILVPFRNEEFRIKPLLSSLIKLNGNFEVIFIDDHSSDLSVKVIRSTLQNSEINFEIYTNEGEGKKLAILTGVKHSKFPIIYTTDADCILPNNWLQSLNNFISFDLLKGPIILSKPKKIFQYIASVENMMLNLFILGNKNMLSSGANLAYRKQTFIETNPYDSNSKVLSGDDMFFVEKLSGNRIGIHYICVETAQEKHYTSLLSQSVRWADKTKYLNQKKTVFIGSLVLLTNLWVIFLAVSSLFFDNLQSVLLLFVLIKFVIDFLFLFLIARFLKKLNILKYALLVELLYPFHLVFVLLYSIGMKNKWKGRSI